MSILKSKRKCSQIKYNRIEPPGAALIECPGRAVRRALWQQVSTHGGRQTTDHYVHATLIVAHLGRSTVPWSKTIWLSVFRRESVNQSTNQRDTTRGVLEWGRGRVTAPTCWSRRGATTASARTTKSVTLGKVPKLRP